MNKYLFLFFILQQAFALDVTFRYVETPGDDFVRVFVPGTMPPGTDNDWGPNSNSMISPSAPSLMNYNEYTDCYEKTYDLDIGEEHFYKLHFHYNNSGTNYAWVPDPLNPNMTDDGWDNSILNITDPLFFQPTRHLNNNNEVTGFSTGIFTDGTIDLIRYSTGGDTLNGLDHFSDNGVFYIPFDPVMTLYDPIWVEVSIDGELFTVYEFGAIDIIEEPLPVDVTMGPNWINETMYLAVYAPAQPVMKVIVTSPGVSGDDADALTLKKDPNMEDTWWIEIDLPQGQYEYEYLLINGSRIADPFSRRLTNGRTRIEIGPGGISTADNYQWQSVDYVRPSLDTLIIYELHVDDFAAQGNGQGRFDDIRARLGHLHSTGINAIELLPITDFPGTHSWGYDPNLMSAVESRYGTPEDLKGLVDEAHSMGMAVIMDVVWNHIRSSSPIWEIQPNYNLNPYIKQHDQLNPNETEGSWGMLDWDHFNPKTIEYINSVNKIWIDEYKIDGFRFDATRMIGWQMSQPQYGILGWTSFLQELDPTIIQIAEHLPSDPWLVDNSALTSAWHDSFHDVLLSDAHGQYNSATTFMNQVVRLHEYSNVNNSYSDRTQAVKYMISHDEQSILQEMVVFNNYSIEEARERDRFYANILFTSLGVPMLFQGQEFGLQTGWNDDNNNGDYEEKLQYRPIDWSLLDTEIGQSHLEHYSKLIKFRKDNPAFYKGTFHDLWRYEAERVIVYGYKDESEGNNNDQVVVIANFSEYDRTVNDVPFLSSGTWYNVLEAGNDLVTNDGNVGEYFINGKTAIIYANQQWDLGINDATNVPDQFQMIKAYPNPFNAQVNIKLDINRSTSGILQIFDIKGQLVRSFSQSDFQQGEHLFVWDSLSDDGNTQASGVYITSFTSPLGSINTKLLLIK